MLIINELLRCSNIEGERVRQEMEDVYQQQHQHEKSFKVGTVNIALMEDEPLRCSNIEGERVRQEMEDVYQQQHQHEKSFKVADLFFKIIKA